MAAACETLARTGERMGERCAERATRGMDPFADEQSAIMCACKEFWTQTHGNEPTLKTNNKGTFVFHDDSFRAMRGVVGGARGDERDDGWETRERRLRVVVRRARLGRRRRRRRRRRRSSRSRLPRPSRRHHPRRSSSARRARAFEANSSDVRVFAARRRRRARDPPAVPFTVDVVRPTDPRDEENS